METRKFNDLRDELFMLTGIAVAQFQFLEHVVTACMGFVWPEKSEQMFAEITSTDPLRRGETIGRMLAELRKRIQVPNHFDERLSTFIEGRNRLIHHLFREHARTGEVPPQTEMEETKQFISQLSSEAEQLRHVFL